MERYTGDGEPPCIVMTLRAISDVTMPHDLTLPVTLTGVKLSQPLKLERKVDIPTTGEKLFMILVIYNTSVLFKCHHN